MSKTKKTTTTSTIPSWLEQGSQLAVTRAQEIANRPYTPYAGQRVAGLDTSEQQAYDMAVREQGSWRPDLQRARTFTERGAQTFTDADLSGYMNPYIKGALDPTAREVRNEYERQRNAIGQRAAQVGAFGGDRQAILESENQRLGGQAISDLYAQGYAQAFESGANRWQADRDAAARAAEQYRATAAQNQQQVSQDMQNLLTTGGLKRQLRQANLDFDYQQYVEARDWSVTNLQPLLATLSSVPHSSTQTNTQKTRDPIGSVIGLASTAAGIWKMGFGGGGGGGGGGGDLQTIPMSSIPSRMSYPGEQQGVDYYPPTFSDPTYYGSAYVPALA